MENLFGKYKVLPLEKGAGEIFEKKIDDYNDTVVPPAADAPEDEELVLKITDQDGNIIAGCLCDIYNWNFMDLDVLWVDEKYRRQGLGSMLIRAAEQAAKDRGCYMIVLGTFDFQARPLYEKHGYTVDGVRTDWPKGHCNYSLSKHLDKGLSDYVPTDHSAWEKYTVERGTEEDGETIVDGLRAHNDAIAPDEHDYIRLNKKVLNENGDMIAGIVAGVGGWDDGVVYNLWVEEPYRNQGIGTWLLQEAEKEMQENGAYMIMVTAFDWASDFFTHRGYAITGVLEDLPQGHREYDLRKTC